MRAHHERAQASHLRRDRAKDPEIAAMVAAYAHRMERAVDVSGGGHGRAGANVRAVAWLTVVAATVPALVGSVAAGHRSLNQWHGRPAGAAWASSALCVLTAIARFDAPHQQSVSVSETLALRQG
jgi:hypothetical protein